MTALKNQDENTKKKKQKKSIAKMDSVA